MTTPRTATQRDYMERMLRVLVHIQEHLDDPLDLGDLAALACFSPYHFHRVFRGMVGEPVKAHVRRLRLERAALQLKNARDDVLPIALAAGYESAEAFSRAFRARFEVSPSAYRQAHARPVPSGVTYSPDGTVHTFQPLTEEDDRMDARIDSLDTMTVAFIRHTGPYDQVGPTWQRMYMWAGKCGLLGPGTRAFGLCHDDPDVTPPAKLRYDACIALDRELEPSGDIGVQTIEGARYAVATHIGPYTQLGETYGQLVGRWMPARDLVPAAGLPALEFYRNNPQMTPPDQLRTDIYMPIADGA